jgi:hypothetical protein
MAFTGEIDGFLFIDEGLLPDGEKSGFKRRSATRRWKVSLMDVHKRKISYCVEGGKIFAKGLLPASLRFSLYAAPSRGSAGTGLCARTPRVEAESRRHSSTSCPVVVLLPFDHHACGNSRVVRWP